VRSIHPAPTILPKKIEDLRSLAAAHSFVSAAIGSMQVDQKRRIPAEEPFDRRGFSAIADRSTEADRTP